MCKTSQALPSSHHIRLLSTLTQKRILFTVATQPHASRSLSMDQTSNKMTTAAEAWPNPAAQAQWSSPCVAGVHLTVATPHQVASGTASHVLLQTQSMTRYTGCSPAAEIHPADAGLHLAAISLGVQHCIPWVEVWRQSLFSGVHNAVTQRHCVRPASACRASVSSSGFNWPWQQDTFGDV